MKTIIEIQNAVIAYSDYTILKDIELEIKEGQHWAFIGQSGTGKTSLLQTIAGNMQLKKGSITRQFHQQHVSAGADYHQLIAFVASKHHFRNLSNTTDFYYQQRFNSSDSEDALTVNDYLNAVKHKPAATRGWTISKVISVLMLETLRDKQLIKLSNGETKRLMIAAALIKNPLLLLLDNPLTGLDVGTRALFNTILAQIAASGITVVMATAPDELPAIITNVGILKNQQVITLPKDKFTTQTVKPEPISASQFAVGPLLDKYPAPAFNLIARLNNVTIKYGSKVILDRVNWQINQGERWALLGHNGAGKSTLLSLINGDNPQAYANDITLFDKRRGSGESIWDIKKKTGFVSPELYQYFPADSSCLQAIESGYYDTIGLFRPSNAMKAARALQWMKVLEIDKYARQLLKNIPASAQRLCLLARAMIKNPTLLILDEPCQGMDEHQQEYFKALIDAICMQTNLTLIYVTHYTQQIPHSVDKTLKLDSGKMV